MLYIPERTAPDELGDRISAASQVTVELMSDVIDQSCRRFPSIGNADKVAWIGHLIHAAAWTEAALALIDFELPQWKLRRLVYDEGEWHCALSRQRALPEWLDQSTDGRHADLALAILTAFIEVLRISAPSSRTSVPVVARDQDQLYEPACCDNFA
jgi:hypothetical protein